MYNSQWLNIKIHTCVQESTGLAVSSYCCLVVKLAAFLLVTAPDKRLPLWESQ